jgi:hypothetical protein
MGLLHLRQRFQHFQRLFSICPSHSGAIWYFFLNRNLELKWIFRRTFLFPGGLADFHEAIVKPGPFKPGVKYIFHFRFKLLPFSLFPE